MLDRRSIQEVLVRDDSLFALTAAVCSTTRYDSLTSSSSLQKKNQPPGRKQRPRSGVRGSPSAGPLPGREVGRPRRAIEAGRRTEGRDRAELGRRRLRRGAPAWTGPPPGARLPPPRSAGGAERAQPPPPLGGGPGSWAEHPRDPGARYLAAALGVPGLRPRHARLQLLEAPTPAAQSGPAAMSAAPRDALWGEGGRESLEGGWRCRAAAAAAGGWLGLVQPCPGTALPCPAPPYPTQPCPALPGSCPAGGAAPPAPQNCPSSGAAPPSHHCRRSEPPYRSATAGNGDARLSSSGFALFPPQLS
ncbi:predicted GPI-anchored protein 58 [Strigops habroptila]|uniref:predicted GPI-anchored protein 58 n=1 Tax=Strigops habroptila TaxID=2489341 RepID=UPI0011CFABBF|nr:predicted GPI-anchored protein 58 [Strigops habroptila]